MTRTGDMAQTIIAATMDAEDHALEASMTYGVRWGQLISEGYGITGSIAADMRNHLRTMVRGRR